MVKHPTTHTRARTFTALLAVALVAAACTGGGADTTTTTPPTTAPSTTTTTEPTTSSTEPPLPDYYGGDVVVGLEKEPATLNPFLPGGDSLAVNLIGQAWSVGVQDIDGETLDLIPEVVVELPTVANEGVVLNDDGTMTVSYEIREGAMWADGEPITGSDFQFTLDIITDPALPINDSVYKDIIDTEVGEGTFSYTLALPTLQYELLFNVLIPEHQVAGSDFEADWNDRTWVSGGPFEFEDWAAGESISFTKNENYWKTDAEENPLPYLDAVEYRFVGEGEEAVAAFGARDVTVLQVEPEWENLAEATQRLDDLAGFEAGGASVEAKNGPAWVHLNFQYGDGRLERNPLSLNALTTFRQAVMHTVDRQRIVDALFDGRVTPLDSYVEAYAPSLSQGLWSQYPHDPVRARQLFAEVAEEAGVDGVRVVLSSTACDESNTDRCNESRRVVAGLLAEMFAEVGVEFENQGEDGIVFFGETVTKGEWDTGMWAWLGSSGLSGLVAFHEAVLDPDGEPPNGSNYYRWGTADSSVNDESTERFSEVLAAMRSTVDEAEIANLVREAEEILAGQAVFLPLYGQPVTAAYWADELEGFILNPTVAGFTWNIEEWRRLQ
jgi:peptide/nickel transport system substrate-binding protein